MKSVQIMKRILSLSIVSALALQSVPLAAMNARRGKILERVQQNMGKKKPNNAKQNKPVNAKKKNANKKVNPPIVRPTQSVTEKNRKLLSFPDKVAQYIADIKLQHGRAEDGSKPIFEVATKIKSASPLKEVRGLIEPIKNLIEKPNPNGQKLQVHDQVGLGLLLKASLPLGEHARSVICEMLHKLDNYLSYWHEQKHHPVHYFFHKSPQKWFFGPKQKQELSNNVDELEVARKDHLRLLSDLVEHESRFNESAPTQDQYQWLADYLTLIARICYHDGSLKLDSIIADEAQRFEKLLTRVYDMFGRVSYHEANLIRVLGGANKPGHITQNWIAYSALALGVGAFAWYAHKNKDRFYNWFDTDVKRGAAYVWGTVSGQMKDFYEAMIGKGEAGRPADYYDQIERDFNRQLDDATQNLIAVRDSLREAQRDVQNRVAPRPVPGQGPNRDESYQAILLAVANYLEGRRVLQVNGTLGELPAHRSNTQAGNNNNNVPAPLAPVSLREIDLATTLPEEMSSPDFARLSDEQKRVFNEQRQQERVILFRTAIERSLVQFAEENRKQVLSDILRQTFTQAITDIRNATASLQNVKSSKGWTDFGTVMGTAAEVSGRVPQLGAAVALFGHVAAIAQVVSQDVMSSFGGTGANLVGNLSDFINTLAGTIGHAQQMRTENGVAVPQFQMNERNERILDENRQPIPVMVPGPLRSGMTSGIDLAKKADQLLTQNKATFILAALIPAGVLVSGLGFGASKLYKLFKYTPNFKPMREALLEIGHLLNEEGVSKEANDEKLDQGKILYLVWKLKRESENVPVLQREQFLADVHRLGRSDLDQGKRIWTAEKKLRIIDLMYRTYDFLNPAYVAQ